MSPTHDSPLINGHVVLQDDVAQVGRVYQDDAVRRRDDMPPARRSRRSDPYVGRVASRTTERVVYHIDLLRELVSREMKVRYKRSILGIGWTLLNPLAQMLVFTFVFRFVLPLDIPDYPLFLFVGIVAWNWFQSSLYSGSNAVLDNGPLFKHPGFPIAILPVANMTMHMVHFLLALIPLVTFLALTGKGLSFALLVLPLVIALQFCLSLALTYFVAPLQVKLRDTQYTVGLMLMLGFYLTPVFYSLDSIPQEYQFVFQINPLAHLIHAYRAVLVHGTWPAMLPLLLLAAFCAPLLVISHWFYLRASYQFVDDL